jgi:hypothetical protein
MLQAGDSVRYNRRLFVLVRVLPAGWAIIRDDEGEEMRVRLASLSPA